MVQDMIEDLQRMLCQKVVEPRMLLRPKKRYIKFGLAFMSASAIDAYSPAGLIAGAKAINTSTFSLSLGWILRLANAWAVP